MAFFSNQFSIFLLLTLLISLQIHARESQFFNKVTSTNGNTVVPETKQPLNTQQNEQQQQQQQQQPDFIPDNENGYGLYGHETGQLPPSATTTTTTALSNTESTQPLNRHLPKNYNPVAYVTVPEENVDESTTQTEEQSYATNPTNYNNGASNYYNGQQEELESRSYPSTNTNGDRNNYNYNYNGGSRFNSQPQGLTEASFDSQPQGLSDTRARGGATLSNRETFLNNNNNNGGNVNGFQPQGMSDTRAFQNGKYFYDINTDKYSSNHPYASLRNVQPTYQQYSNRNYYTNSENANDFNNENNFVGGGYQNQEEFQYEENNLP